MYHLVVLLVACGFAAAIGYKVGLVHGINASQMAQVATNLAKTLSTPAPWENEPLPEGFNPRTQGGKELDDLVPLVEVVPTYYEYDTEGEATGKRRKEPPTDEVIVVD